MNKVIAIPIFALLMITMHMAFASPALHQPQAVESISLQEALKKSSAVDNFKKKWELFGEYRTTNGFMAGIKVIVDNAILPQVYEEPQECIVNNTSVSCS